MSALFAWMFLLTGMANADDGWRCEAEGSWSLCARSPDQCTSHVEHVPALRTTESDARSEAVHQCQLQLGAERLRQAFIENPERTATDITRIDTACRVTSCEPAEVEPNPYADAFDEPVCIEVRRYVCSLCGTDSPLCSQVQSEQPVTADACSQTHARLATFSDLLGQVDTLQPGSWTDARRELCGIP